MPDSRKETFNYIDVLGHRQQFPMITIRGNRPKFQRWCACGRLTPSNMHARAENIRCQLCTKKARPSTFLKFLTAQIDSTMEESFCAPTATTINPPTVLGAALLGAIQ
jgi:hypothetical protein